MMNRNRMSDANLQQWLNQFTNEVDYKRFQRGMTLYNDHRTSEFQVFPNHFECVVEGVKSNYVVEGYFQLENGIPRLEDYELTCSCPDDVPICKHGVCATMYFTLDQLGKEGEPSREEIEDARVKLIEEPLGQLHETVHENMESILSLHEHRGSRFLDNRVFIEKVHERITKVMDELQNRSR